MAGKSFNIATSRKCGSELFGLLVGASFALAEFPHSLLLNPESSPTASSRNKATLQRSIAPFRI